MLEERDEGGRHRHHLARRDVHVVDLGVRDLVGLAVTLAHQDAIVDETAVVIDLGVGLGDDVTILLVRGQVDDLVGDLPVDDLTVRGLDEAEGVDAGEGGQRTNQTDVRTLRGLNWAHTTVVRRVDVSNLHAGAVTGQTAGSQGRQTTLVGHLGQRVVLVHELRQLGGSEEFLDRGRHRTDVDQGLRGDGLDVLGGHAVTHDTLHPTKTGTQLILDELADGAQTAVAEMVDVVGLDDDVVASLAREHFGALVQGAHVVDRRDDVVDRQHLLVERQKQTELLVDLVTTNLGQIVALRVEVVILEQLLGGVTGRRLARTQLLVDVQQRLILSFDAVILLEGLTDRLVVAELLEDAVSGPAEGLEENGDVLLALTVQTNSDGVALVDLELEPSATRRNHLAREDILVGGLVGGLLEVDTRGTHQLGDDDTLGAVDDEGALRGHEREVTDEDRLGLDLLGLVIHELRGHEQRGRVGGVAILALVDAVLGILETVIPERQGHRLGVVLDRGDLLKDLLEAGLGVDIGAPLCKGGVHMGLPYLVANKPVERLNLQVEKVGNLQRLVNLGE